MSRVGLLIGTAIIALSTATSSSHAQDATGWTGPYLGAQLGVLQANGTIDPFLPVPDTLKDETVSLQQGLAGLYGGYNVRSGDLVWGIEGDVSGKVGQGVNSFSGDLGIPGGWRSTSSWEASLRGRLGLLQSESVLLYGTAGLALSDFNLDNPGCPGCAAWGTTDILGGTRFGGVAGAGVEYAATDNLHLKLEAVGTFYPTLQVNMGPPGYDSWLSEAAIRGGISFALK